MNELAVLGLLALITGLVGTALGIKAAVGALMVGGIILFLLFLIWLLERMWG